MAKIMFSGDALSASLAECFITIDGNRYSFANMTEFEANVDKKKIEVPLLGQTGKGHKAAGWTGKFKGKMYYNTSLFRKILEKYKDTGEDTYMEIQISNEDKTSTVGRQTIVLYGCNLDGGIIAKFSANDDLLEEEVNGTFEDWKIPQEFTMLSSMQ